MSSQFATHSKIANISITVLCCLILAAADRKAFADGSNWMGALDSRKSLAELSIPGTHDAGALFEPLKGTTKCQNLSIADQLKAGVRFLDIRCYNAGKELTIYHGIVYQRLSFAQVVQTVTDFLRSNPAETIVMSIKEENSNTGSAFAAVFDSYVAKDPGIWYVKPTIPSLGAVRGKIVLFRRFSGTVGIDASKWPDNTTFVNENMKVEDNYQLATSDAKWTAVQKHLDAARAGDNKSLYLTFASGYTVRTGGLPDITSVSGPVNALLSGYFEAAGKGRFGVILLDFADATLCSKIIETNPLPPR